MRKQGLKWWRKTQENHFKNTLDKTPLLIENICSQISGENFLMKLEKLAQNSLKNLSENSPQNPKFIGLEKLAVGSQVGLPVDRPVDRPTVRILTVEPAIDRLVDRGQDTESRLSARSTGPVDRPGRPGLSREQKLSAVDRVGRPPESSALSKGPGRPGGRPDREQCSLYPSHGRPAGRPLAQRSEK